MMMLMMMLLLMMMMMRRRRVIMMIVLKVCQERVVDLEREKKEIEGNITKKDQDIILSQRRLEDEQAIVGKAQKTVKVETLVRLLQFV